MKTYVITVARMFPATHSKKGQPTNFIEAILNHIKLHTIRVNYQYWKPRIEEVIKGNAVLSVRVWTGRPYRSTPKQVFELTGKNAIGISLIEQTQEGWFVDGQLTDLTTEKVAENDGLSLEDFEEWFKGKAGPMALIYFGPFRYKRYNFNFREMDNLVFDYDTREYPRFENAFLESGDYGDRELTEEEVEWINENEHGFVHEALTDHVS